MSGVTNGPPNASSLSVAESTELAERLAELSQAGLPLSAGLRAAADDAGSARLAGVLRMIAGELDAGVSLDVALGRLERRLPAYVQGVVRAGVRSGELATLLGQMAAADRRRLQTRREIYLALAYPSILLALMVALLLFVVFLVLPQMETIYNDFDTELPALTNILVNTGNFIRALFSSPISLFFLGLCGLVLLAYFVYRIGEWLAWMTADPAKLRSPMRATNQLSTAALAARCWPSRILSTFPLIGPLILWSQVAAWSRLLAVLVEARVPLAEALSLSAQGTRSANLANLSDQLAEQVRGGSLLSEQIRRLIWLPMSMVPITEWGEKSGQLPEALRTVAEMYEGRVLLRAALVRQVAPPIFFILIASFGLFLTAAIFLPLSQMIRYLA